MSVHAQPVLHTETVRTEKDVQAAVQSAPAVIAGGSGTKPAMRVASPEALALDLRGLSGIVEYIPAEYTITALAGTAIAEIEDALKRNGQYLPFDPVLVEAGTTVGGAVASGLSGPGRLRYGGIRDFILGARFVDGQGRLLRGGGKVVKNAAGFDFPKLLVGSMGRLGILVDATFKVFPRPVAHATVLAEYASIEGALVDMRRLTLSPVELIAIDILVSPEDGACTLAVRIGGAADLLDARINRLRAALPGATVSLGEEEAEFWLNAVEFSWADPALALVKVPVTPHVLPACEEMLSDAQTPRRYAVAGNVLWLAWDGPVDRLGGILASHKLTGVALRGPVVHPLIGHVQNTEFAQRVKNALDPHAKFPPVYPH